jgi:hypothetical protein
MCQRASEGHLQLTLLIAASVGEIGDMRPHSGATGPLLGDRRQLQGRETTLRTTSKINAVSSPRVIAPSDQQVPGGRLLGTAAPNLDTQEQERWPHPTAESRLVRV